MTTYRDLEPINNFSVDSGVMLRAVGWLGKEFEFSTGEVSPEFFRKLCQLSENPWQPIVSAGFHICELCQFHDCNHTATGTSNLFIPFDNMIYVAPELIVHYVNVHYYLPPDVFLDAVMHCPSMQSMEYKRSLLKNGGKALKNKLAK